MKVIEDKFVDHVFPAIYECENCGSILEVERNDCEQKRIDETWCLNRYRYHFMCPCCKQEQWIDSNF